MIRILCRVLSAFVVVAACTVGAAAEAHAAGYATDDAGRLFRVYPTRKEVELIGTVAVPAAEGAPGSGERPTLTDLALHDEHGMYGISYGVLYRINLRDPGRSERIGNLETGAYDVNALEFDDDGTLYAAGGSVLYRVDRKTGRATKIGVFGANWSSDGDLAWLDGALYATVNGPAGCLLVTVDVKTGKAKAVAGIRTPDKRALFDVWGLIWDGRTLWALSPAGEVFALDRKTAVATPAFRTSIAYWGACPMLRI